MLRDLKPKHKFNLESSLRMVWDVLRFGREAPKARARMERMAIIRI